MVVDNDTYTKLLIHCDGADESTDFYDVSASGHTITAGGTAKVDTAQSKFGGASCLLDGDSDYLQPADHADWTFGTGPFTIDLWVRANTISGDQAVFGHYLNSTNYFDLVHNATNGFKVKIVSGGTTLIDLTETTSPISTNTWYHLAMIRNGTAFDLYKGGSSILNDTDSGSLFDPSGFRFGYSGYFVGNAWWDGWQDEIRVSKGIARWATTFDPPTSAYALGISVHDCSDLEDKMGG